MYVKHFGLRERPFRPTPDIDAYYPATSHESALALLLQALDEDEGLVLLTGEPGTGKTLVCHRLLERLGEETTSAFLTNSHVDGPGGLLQAVLFELSLPYEGKDTQEMRLALTDYLLQNFASGRRAVLVVDEAQNLVVEVLEELRLLGNLEAREGKALQVVLVGQLAIEETLALPELSAFRQRLAVRVRLEPLDVHESADYLVHHFRQAGGRSEAILDDEAVDLLARGTHGVPRLLNQAAHLALKLTAAAEAPRVDAEAVLEALARLGIEIAEEDLAGRLIIDPAEGDGLDPEPPARRRTAG